MILTHKQNVIRKVTKKQAKAIFKIATVKVQPVKNVLSLLQGDKKCIHFSTLGTHIYSLICYTMISNALISFFTSTSNTE